MGADLCAYLHSALSNVGIEKKETSCACVKYTWAGSCLRFLIVHTSGASRVWIWVSNLYYSALQTSDLLIGLVCCMKISSQLWRHSKAPNNYFVPRLIPQLGAGLGTIANGGMHDNVRCCLIVATIPAVS